MENNNSFQHFLESEKNSNSAAISALAFLRGYFGVADCDSDIISLFDGIERELKQHEIVKMKLSNYFALSTIINIHSRININSLANQLFPDEYFNEIKYDIDEMIIKAIDDITSMRENIQKNKNQEKLMAKIEDYYLIKIGNIS